MDAGVDAGVTVTLARCGGCDAVWWAVIDESDDVARLSGLECPRCSAMLGRFVGTRTRFATATEAMDAVRRMRAEIMDEG